MSKIHFHLVLTREEEAKLTTDSETCGLTKSAYLRRLITGNTPRARRPDEIRKLVAEINKIGSNVNQVACAANTGQMRKEDARNLLFLLDQVYQRVDEILKL